MADKKHRNPIRIATTTQVRENEAINALLSRELLYNRNNKTLGIVLEDEEGNKYRQIVSGLVDEVNITKNENYETKLKEDIIIDSVTTQADHNGVDWKSQYKIAETTAERTVILLCTQDIEATTDIGVIGGEILEVGVGVYGHYQMSLTSTGSRLLKGATTNEKKAKIVLAKYNGTYYYGIKFKSNSPANIYFAGWSKIPDGLSAPLYTTYNDGDMSEIIELDDDSDTGTQVIDFNFFTYDDFTWEFLDAPVVHNTISKTESWDTNSSTLVERNDFVGEGTSSFGTGYAHRNNYHRLHFYKTVNYTAPSTGATVTASHNIALGGWYITLASSGLAGYVYIPGGRGGKGTISVRALNQNTSSTRKIRLYKINSDRSIGDSVAEVTVPATNQWTDLTFDELDSGEYYFYQTGQLSYSNFGIVYHNETTTVLDSKWHEGGSNADYDLTNGLSIVTGTSTRWYEGSLANNTGYITFDKVTSQSSPAMKLEVLADCKVTVGFNTNSSNRANLRITESLDITSDEWSKSVSENCTGNSSITEVSYDYTGSGGTLYFLGETQTINILYVQVDYDNSVSNGLKIVEIVSNLKQTGEDGSPHIIRLSGSITKEAILNIAKNLKDPNKQIILDLSQCTMEAAYTDWSADGADSASTPQGGMYSAFNGCVSLREFYYPHNVTSSGGNTFKNCSFLRKVVFNEEMLHIGANSSVWSWDNNVLFSGARIKTVYLPKSVNDFGGYPFAYSNIVNIFFEEGSAFVNGGNFGQWNTFVQTKEDLRFRCPQDLYDVWKNSNTTFESYGADGDGKNFIASSCKRSDHVVLWEGEYEDIDYTASYEV